MVPRPLVVFPGYLLFLLWWDLVFVVVVGCLSSLVTDRWWLIAGD